MKLDGIQKSGNPILILILLYENDILATGVKVTTQNENEGLDLGGEIAELITSEEFYDFNFTGLRFPSLFFDPAETTADTN